MITLDAVALDHAQSVKEKKMSTEAHTFCRLHLKVVMEDVRERMLPETIRTAWAYRYSFGGSVDFHIGECPEVPEGYNWHGAGCCAWIAKAYGWSAFLEQLDEKAKEEKEKGIELQ